MKDWSEAKPEEVAAVIRSGIDTLYWDWFVSTVKARIQFIKDQAMRIEPGPGAGSQLALMQGAAGILETMISVPAATLEGFEESKKEEDPGELEYTDPMEFPGGGQLGR